MAVPIQTGLVSFFDDEGRPLSHGKVFTFVSGQEIEAQTFIDPNESIANDNPIVLNSSGQAYIYASQNITFKIYDKCNSYVGDIIGSVPIGVGTGGDFSTLPDLTV